MFLKNDESEQFERVGTINAYKITMEASEDDALLGSYQTMEIKCNLTNTVRIICIVSMAVSALGIIISIICISHARKNGSEFYSYKNI